MYTINLGPVALLVIGGVLTLLGTGAVIVAVAVWQTNRAKLAVSNENKTKGATK